MFVATRGFPWEPAAHLGVPRISRPVAAGLQRWVPGSSVRVERGSENAGLQRRGVRENLLSEIATARRRAAFIALALVRSIGRTTWEETSLPKTLDERHLPAVLVP